MTMTSVASVRLRPSRKALNHATNAEHSVVRRVKIIWGLLFLNVLTFTPHSSAIPIPSVIGKGITQGSLQVALLLALTVNRKILVRPSLLLCIISLFPLEAIVTLITSPHFTGTAYRTVRYIEFVATLWLLTPYWGRRDMLLVRSHLLVMGLVLTSVTAGIFVDPGLALAGGRLTGAIWPAPPTQIAHYAAVTIGMVVILWLCGHRSGRSTIYVVVPSIVLLLLTHTRTALTGLVAGLAIAGLSMIATNARVRKVFIITIAIAGTATLTLSNVIVKWLSRGQDSSQLTNLTGRTNFWAALEAAPRNKFQEIFGFGLSNGTFNGQAVDSNWMLSYQDQGIFGVVVCATILVLVLVTSLLETRRLNRALGLFLAVYCLVASYTEVGITNTSPYLLDIIVAGSLLLPARGSDVSASGAS